MISTIFFDLGGVLVNIDIQSFLIKLSNYYEIGIEHLKNHQSKKSHEDYMKGLITSEQYYNDVKQNFEKQIPLRLFKEFWNSILIDQRNDTSIIVDKLKNKYRLALMSNVDPWHFSFCYDKFPVIRAFKNRFLSYEMHLIKPEREFYLHAIRSLKSMPQDCVFIDDLLENIDAAKALGFNTVHFQNGSQLEHELTKLNLI
ncbi:HAD family phosphatase [candidate division KSB1 bacterium]|nr:HAD family phosphatase [candidate division KSB1 bacterium]